MSYTKGAIFMLAAVALLLGLGVGIMAFWQAVFPRDSTGQLIGALGTIAACPLIAAVIADLRAKRRGC